MRAAYDEVYVYTMGCTGFILQHVVDAFAMQTANDESSPIDTRMNEVEAISVHLEREADSSFACACAATFWPLRLIC